MTVDEVLGSEVGAEVFAILASHLGEGARLRISRTQVGWARRRGFAFLWSPRRWQGASAAPLVLTLTLSTPENSARFKEVYELRPGLWNHHLEVRDVADIDDEVRAWIDRAWQEAS